MILYKTIIFHHYWYTKNDFAKYYKDYNQKCRIFNMLSLNLATQPTRLQLRRQP